MPLAEPESIVVNRSPLLAAVPALWLSLPAVADLAPPNPANLALLEVADPSALGHYGRVDEACGFGGAELALMVEDVLIRNAIRPHADARSPEGLNLDLHVACFEPEPDGTRLFSIRAAFSLVGTDGSDVLVNRDYGTFGRGDPAFVELAVDEAVEAAVADFRAANAHALADGSI